MAAVMRGSRIRAYKSSDFQGPESISSAIPNWVFPNGAGSPACHQSRPDALESSFCALFQADKLTLILPRSLLKTGTSTSLN
eukprot:68412-Pelagomonas_calceolata.AAC.2